MAFTYVATTSRGQVRLLIPDRTDTGHLFEDAEIDAFLSMEANVVKLAAAAALETIASDNAMVLKVIRLLDLTTDGAKTSDALLKRAGLLREQAAAEDYTGGIDWAEMVVDDFSLRARLEAEALR
jgi:hypothetical protein